MIIKKPIINNIKKLIKHPGISWWQLFVLFLSIYSLLALGIEQIFQIRDEEKKLLLDIDNFICLVFIIDFFQQLYRAPNKWEYLRWGWIDLLSGIPNLQIFGLGRLFRVVKIIRVLRGVRSTNTLMHYLFKDRAESTFASAAILSLGFVIFSSIVILDIENVPGTTIHTASDAIWWSIETITTVGYGDVYPVTNEGRILATLLMIAGVGLFGVFTAYAAAFFIEPEEKRDILFDQKMMKEVKTLNARLARIEKKMNVGKKPRKKSIKKKDTSTKISR